MLSTFSNTEDRMVFFNQLQKENRMHQSERQ